MRLSPRTGGTLSPGGAADADEHPSSFRSEGRDEVVRLGAFIGDLPDGLLFRLPGTRGTDAG